LWELLVLVRSVVRKKRVKGVDGFDFGGKTCGV
jgi:hypothetical protein